MSQTLGSGTITVEAAFGDAPLTATASNTWTDITAYVMEVSTRRGRSHSLDSVQPGTATIKLDNSDRRFDPLHATGAYYGDLEPNVKVRVTFTYGGTDYRIFTGFINGWPQSYDGGDSHATCTVTAVDAFKLLGLHQLDTSMFTSLLASLRPTHWWRLGESDASGRIVDSGSAGTHALAPVPPEMGNTGMDSGEPSASSLGGDGYGGTTVYVGVGSENPVRPQYLRVGGGIDGWTSAVFLVRMPNPDVQDDPDGVVGVYGGTIFWAPDDFGIEFDFDGDTYRGRARFDDVTEGYYRYNLTNVADGKPHVMGVKRNSSTYPTLYLDGDGDSSFVQGAAVTLLGDGDVTNIAGRRSYNSGSGTDAKEGFGGYLQHLALFTANLTTNMSDLADAALTAFVGDQTGTRLGRILDIVGWASADRDIDTGATSLQVAAPSGATALSYAQTLERTEQGIFFVAGDGDLTFVDRDALRSETRYTTSQTTFSDDGSDDPYLAGSLAFDYDDELVRNECVVSGDGIESQRAIDTTSVTSYGQRTESLSTFIADERVARNLAEYRVEVRKDPATRPAAFSIRPERDAATIYPTLCDLEIGDRITVQRTPQGVGSQISLEAHLDSIAWRFTPGDITATLTASPVEDESWFTWGTSNWDGSDVWSY